MVRKILSAPFRLISVLLVLPIAFLFAAFVYVADVVLDIIPGTRLQNFYDASGLVMAWLFLGPSRYRKWQYDAKVKHLDAVAAGVERRLLEREQQQLHMAPNAASR